MKLFGNFEISQLLYKEPIYGQCKLLPYVYIYDFENFQLNIVD